MTSDVSVRWYGTGPHRTRTIELRTGERYKTRANGSNGRWVTTTIAKAECVCGWSAHRGDRNQARAAARWHRTRISVAAADLAAFVRVMSEHACPRELHPPIRRLDEVSRAAGETRMVTAPLVDFEALLPHMNRPDLFAELPWLPRLLDIVKATTGHPVAMSESVTRYCLLVATSHQLSLEEWIDRVTAAATLGPPESRR